MKKKSRKENPKNTMATTIDLIIFFFFIIFYRFKSVPQPDINIKLTKLRI